MPDAAPLELNATAVEVVNLVARIGADTEINECLSNFFSANKGFVRGTKRTVENLTTTVKTRDYYLLYGKSVGVGRTPPGIQFAVDNKGLDNELILNCDSF